MREFDARGGVRIDAIREFTAQKAERLTFGRRHEGIWRPLRRPDRRHEAGWRGGWRGGFRPAAAKTPHVESGDVYIKETPLET